MSLVPWSAGIDVGATLCKVVFQGEGLETARFPSGDQAALHRHLERWRPRRIAATGGGADGLEPELLGTPVQRVAEFEAWALGAAMVAAVDAVELPEGYLLVSLGTGTSILAVRGGRARRVGGSALGGGTLLGLGRLLLGAGSFRQIAELAAGGDRRNVDLLVGDIYQAGGIALPAELNAASFGKLASTRPEDLAHALMGLIGENVGIIATSLARAAGVEAIVYCGSTLEDNPALQEVLATATRTFGGLPLYLPRGAYCGAFGAAGLLS